VPASDKKPVRRRARARTSAAGELPPPRTNYFLGEKDVELFTSGCTLLDCALGGGWAEGRIINIVGDKATGKTLLAIEACANFVQKHPDGDIQYIEAEAAFDQGYAAALGMPVDAVKFAEDIFTVEELFTFLTAISSKAERPTLVIVDSLDALSDTAEMERGMDEGTFGASKAKKLSELFRRLTKKLSKHVTVIIISQVREAIGVTFGRKTTRSGGKALDFYCSQILYLANRGQIYRETKGMKRSVGVDITAKVDKNKVGLPHREAEFPIIYGYGIDDLFAHIEFLQKLGKLEDLGLKKTTWKAWLTKLRQSGGPELQEHRSRASQMVKEEWAAIEEKFIPARGKYQ
jgi:recombination protein RecA